MGAEFDAFWRAKNICARFSFPEKLLFVLKLKQTHSAFAYNNAEIPKEFKNKEDTYNENLHDSCLPDLPF